MDFGQVMIHVRPAVNARLNSGADQGSGLWSTWKCGSRLAHKCTLVYSVNRKQEVNQTQEVIQSQEVNQTQEVNLRRTLFNPLVLLKV